MSEVQQVAEVTKSGFDLLSGGGIVGGLVAIVTSLGWFIRKEKSEAAKNRTDIALSDSATKSILSQSEENEILRKRITDQDVVIVGIMAEMAAIKHRISILETGRDIATMHLKSLNVQLCPECRKKNKDIFDNIIKALYPENFKEDKKDAGDK